MGPTLKNYYDDFLRNANRLGDIVDDERIEERQLLFWLNQLRAQEIEKDVRRQLTGENGAKTLYPHIDQSLVQDLGCWPLVCVDKAECNGLKWGCDILKGEDFPDFV